MAKNSNGEVYLTTARSSIQHFDSDGTLLNEFAAGGKLLTSIALDSK